MAIDSNSNQFPQTSFVQAKAAFPTLLNMAFPKAALFMGIE
jgi:hypothetical protein